MRNSFLPPIPEIDAGLDLVSRAADAFLDGRIDLAKRLLVEADFPEIAVYCGRIVGKTDPSLHWQHKQPTDLLPPDARLATRMPSPSTELFVFERDGWKCRFCGCRVLDRKARAKLCKAFPDETHWSREELSRHSVLHALSVSLDHIVPHSRGGTNDVENLVTACYVCQFGRNCWTLAEVGFEDPRSRSPVVDTWDGLRRLLAQ
jgi:5-methylcytosine-specific restriction endonuclease McrA